MTLAYVLLVKSHLSGKLVRTKNIQRWGKQSVYPVNTIERY